MKNQIIRKQLVAPGVWEMVPNGKRAIYGQIYGLLCHLGGGRLALSDCNWGHSSLPPKAEVQYKLDQYIAGVRYIEDMK